MGAFMLGLGVAGQIVGAVQTADANGQAQKTQGQEAQLLNEAHLQQKQLQEDQGLITTRNAQESALNPPNQKFTGNDTIKTGPLGLPTPDPGAPKSLLGS